MTIRKILDVTKASLVLAIIASLLLPAQSGAVIQGQLVSNALLQTYSGSLRTGLTNYPVVYSPIMDSKGNYFALVPVDSSAIIVKLDNNGSLLKEITIPAPFELDFPGLTIDKNDNIYVSVSEHIQGEGTKNHILRFNQNGSRNLTISGLNDITNADNGLYGLTLSIAVDPQGIIYASAGDFIAKFTSGGTLIDTTATLYEGSNRAMPYALAFHGNKLYAQIVIENDPNSSAFVAELNSNGEIVRKLDNGNRFPVGYGLATDGNGNVYALSMTSFENGPAQCMNVSIQVRKYNSAGNYLGNINTSAEASEGPVCGLYGVGAAGTSIGITSHGDILLGSGNLDGILGDARIVKYSYPHNQAAFVKNSHTAAASLSVSGDATIISATNNTLTNINAPADGSNSYPLGLVRFSATVNHTNPVNIELLFATDLLPNQVVARKYNSVTRQYGDVPGATITTALLDGKPALKLSYSVLDGGVLDEDGVVNGTIVDPVGLAVTETPLLAPNTGFERTGFTSFSNILTISFSIVALCIALLFAKRKYYR